MLPTVSFCSFYLDGNPRALHSFPTRRSSGLGHLEAGSGRGRHRRRDPQQRPRSEEHTSELQSHSELVCRLLLEKKNHATIGHAISRDLKNWTVIDDALHPGADGDWDDLATWT